MRRSFQALKNPQIQLAIAALAVGIGATTAIYTVIHAVLLEPLPWSDASRWFYVFGHYRAAPPDTGVAFTYKNEQNLEARLQSTSAFGCYDGVRLVGGNYNAVFNGQAVHLAGLSADPALIRSLGVQPSLGRWFDEERTAVISNSLWRRFGSDPQILGKTIAMNGAPYRIVGVAPPSFRFPVEEPGNGIWTPLVADQGPGESNYLYCLAKLKPGIPKPQFENELNTLQTEWSRDHKDHPDGAMVLPLLDFVNRGIRPTLLLLLGASGALLLIACASVASLLLARAVGRARETAVRVALGATSWQLGRQYFGEGLMVALPAAALGTLASIWAVRQVLALAADDIPRADHISLNWQVLAATLGIAAGCAIFFSLAPSWQARRTSPNEALGEGARASAGARSRGLLRAFVVVEMALAFGLAAIAGLLLVQLWKLHRVQPGFDPNHVLTLTMIIPAEKHPNAQSRVDYDAKLVEAMRAVPGVEAAGFGWRMPLLLSASTTMWHDGELEPDFRKAPPVAQDFISPDYFRAMGIPLLEGRFFTDSDGEPEPKKEKILPLIVNQSAARFYWGGRDPLGSLVRLHSFSEPRFQVVGVVGDIRNLSLGEPVRPEVYFSFREVPLDQMAWAIRSPLSQESLVRGVRQAVATVDPDQAIFDVRPLTEIVANSIARQRLGSFMVSFFAVSALILAILGVYGVVAYSVRQRTTEMGTRMALGADSRDLLRLVIGDGLKMSAIGIGVGLIAVLALARWLSSTDLHLQFDSPWPFLAACAITAGSSGLACFVPGWRTSRLSPLIAIRNDVRGSAAEAPRSLKPPPPDNLDLLAGLVDAGREAESFSDAIQSALDTLRTDANAEFALLLLHSAPGEPYRAIGASGTSPSLSYPADNLLLPRLRHYSTALAVTKGDLDSALRWAEETAPGRVDEIRMLKEMGAALAAPVTSKSEEFGLLLLGAPLNRAEFSSGERRAIYRAGSHFALLISNARLADRVVEQEKLKREVQVASEVQKRLFPEKLPETAAIHYAALCIPARGVGGDYYDFLDLGAGRTGIALADVAGKGIAAALVMSVVQASLRSLAETNGASLADLAAKMNRLLYRSTGTSSYATFFYGQVDEDRRELRYVNAGHNPPYVLRRDGALEELPAGGLIIGMFPVARYEEAAVALHPGDVLLAFTDGVSEAHDPAEEEFGEDRLKDLLQRTGHLPVNEMASQILGELKGWMRDAPQFDDLTFILMQVR
ncbi:MAG TPA: ADOP family duplicated permease [Bryobacteraceae bacterium]|jgi:predicted permease